MLALHFLCSLTEAVRGLLSGLSLTLIPYRLKLILLRFRYASMVYGDLPTRLNTIPFHEAK